MSGRLVAEVLDNASAHGLTHAEVRLMVCIAERANDATRECWPGMDELRHRMDVETERAVGKVLRSLASKGLEVRRPVKSVEGRGVRDSDGRPLFAVRGHQTVYRVPDMKARPSRTA